MQTSFVCNQECPDHQSCKFCSSAAATGHVAWSAGFWWLGHVSICRLVASVWTLAIPSITKVEFLFGADLIQASAIVESPQALTSTTNCKVWIDFKTHFRSLQPKTIEQSSNLGKQAIFLGANRDLAAGTEAYIPASEVVLQSIAAP